jgi:hypothetical protein
MRLAFAEGVHQRAVMQEHFPKRAHLYPTHSDCFIEASRQCQASPLEPSFSNRRVSSTNKRSAAGIRSHFRNFDLATFCENLLQSGRVGARASFHFDHVHEFEPTNSPNHETAAVLRLSFQT